MADKIIAGICIGGVLFLGGVLVVSIRQRGGIKGMIDAVEASYDLCE